MSQKEASKPSPEKPRMARYPEGGKPISIVYPAPLPITKLSAPEIMRIKRRNFWIVPVPDSRLSGTSNARKCFVERKNSQLLQQFALNYAYNIVTARVLSGEI